MAVFAPEAFGKYYLVDKIAVGGMAEIFKAKSYSHGGFEKLLVIKRILGHLSDNEEFIEMFVDEAKISVTLQHPNIVQIYDFGRIRDNYFIAMECVEGRDIKGILRKLAERKKLLPVEFAVYIAHEMCKGLDYAHKKADNTGKCLNIVHRDISPSNVLVSWSGEVKVADFGIALAASAKHETKAGVLKGKFEYMSPEQAQGKVLDARSDVFATGIILHEMLTGRRLFKTKSELQTLEKIKSVDIEPPNAINVNVPARLNEIVMKALARDPADRYPDCKAVQADLLDYMYPATPDLTHESFVHFLHELFAEEMKEESDRLAESSRVALALWEGTPDLAPEPEWQEPQRTGDGTLGVAQPKKITPTTIALSAILLGLLGYIGVMHYQKSNAPVSTAMCRPNRGCVALIVNPVGGGQFPPGVEPKAYIDGVLVGSGQRIFYNDIEPDKDVVVSVSADGYETKTLPPYPFGPGTESALPLFLTPAAAPVVPAAATTTQQPAAAVQGGRVVFSTSPEGAEIYIDGVLRGKSPIRWADGRAGQQYKVRYVLAGYEVDEFDLRYPQPNDVLDAARTLTPVPQAAPGAQGTLEVKCSANWAEVYADGSKVAASTPAKVPLDAGSHVITAKNPFTGGEVQEEVTVTAGKTDRIILDCK
jgi:serine/threonine protein kinase